MTLLYIAAVCIFLGVLCGLALAATWDEIVWRNELLLLDMRDPLVSCACDGPYVCTFHTPSDDVRAALAAWEDHR